MHVYVDGSINGRSHAGGIAGGSVGTIIDCESGAQVNSVIAGGLVGLNGAHGSIQRSRATGPVVGNGLAGGLVGWQEGMVSQSFATGSVTTSAGHPAGGLSGGTFKRHCCVGPISNSYATGPILGGGSDSALGGLEGRNNNETISFSYSVSSVPATGIHGGFVGFNNGHDLFRSAYWDIDASGNTTACGHGDCDGVTGLSDTQLKSRVPDGFDPKIWGQSPNINDGYPYLLANAPRK